jgi:hypothetical protein
MVKGYWDLMVRGKGEGLVVYYQSIAECHGYGEGIRSEGFGPREQAEGATGRNLAPDTWNLAK